MAQSSAATMNHHTHLTLELYAHLLGSKLVVDLIHDLYLCIVVPRSQSSQLKRENTTQLKTPLNFEKNNYLLFVNS